MDVIKKRVSLLVCSLLVSCLVTMAALTGFAGVMYGLRLGSEEGEVFVRVLYLLGGAAAGFHTGKHVSGRKFLWGMVSGLIYFLVLCLLSLTMAGGVGWNIESFFTVLLLCLTGCGAGAIFSAGIFLKKI